MTTSEDVVVLTSVLTEPEAAMIVAALKQDDIDAVTEGALPSGMRAEAPGDVRILVRRADVDLAKARLIEYRKGFAAIDWSTVDVGEPEE